MPAGPSSTLSPTPPAAGSAPRRLTVDALRSGRRRLARRPVRAFVAGYLSLIAVGTLLLLVPFATRPGLATPPTDALFTAVSAVTVTGLVVVDTLDHWSPVGQVIILLLIQAGGLGIISGSTLLLVLVGRRRQAGLRQRLLVQHATGSASLGDALGLLRRVVVFAIGMELIGAVVLASYFALAGRTLGDAIWTGVFYAVSGFNNAGFDLSGGFQSLIPYQREPVVLVTLGAMIVIGGLGFAICADIGARRSFRRMAVETRIVVITSLLLLIVGFLTISVVEWNRPETLGMLPVGDRITNAAFTSVALRTAGFASVPMPGFADATVYLMLLWMFVGGASGSTAGGVKVGTVAVVALAVAAVARGRPYVSAFERRIAPETVLRAVAVIGLTVLLIVLASMLMAMFGTVGFREGTFEIVSAMGTVGLSMDLTPRLGTPGRLLVMVLMVTGKLGPLTLALALAAREHHVPYRPALEHIHIG
jgi:trk system potassium uptake protein TrkH